MSSATDAIEKVAIDIIAEGAKYLATHLLKKLGHDQDAGAVERVARSALGAAVIAAEAEARQRLAAGELAIAMDEFGRHLDEFLATCDAAIAEGRRELAGPNVTIVPRDGTEVFKPGYPIR